MKLQPKPILHCWMGRAEHIENVHGFHSDLHLATYNEPSATCMLAKGHEGPHEFTDDGQIGITFSADGDR